MRARPYAGSFAMTCVMVWLVMHDSSLSQERKAGLTGAAFLKVGVGARAVGMGSAVAALRGEPNQMFWNPAGIAMVNEFVRASFNYNKWIADIGHNSAAVAINWKNIGTVGVGFISFGLSGIPADRDIPTDPSLIPFQIDRNSSTTYDYRDIAFQVTFARYVTNQLSLGLTIKSVSQSIDGEKTSTMAFDFGSIYDIGILDWTIAARFSNLGGDLKFYDIAYGLPLTFSIATAIAPLNDGDNRLLFAVDAVKPQDGPQYFFSGVEYTFMNVVSVRGGWKLNYSATDDGGTATRSAVKSTVEGLSIGGGVRTEIADYPVGVDYSYTHMNLLSAAHRISIHFGY